MVLRGFSNFPGLINPTHVPGLLLQLRQLHGGHSRVDCAVSNPLRETLKGGLGVLGHKTFSARSV